MCSGVFFITIPAFFTLQRIHILFTTVITATTRGALPTITTNSSMPNTTATIAITTHTTNAT